METTTSHPDHSYYNHVIEEGNPERLVGSQILTRDRKATRESTNTQCRCEGKRVSSVPPDASSSSQGVLFLTFEFDVVEVRLRMNDYVMTCTLQGLMLVLQNLFNLQPCLWCTSVPPVLQGRLLSVLHGCCLSIGSNMQN